MFSFFNNYTERLTIRFGTVTVDTEIEVAQFVLDFCSRIREAFAVCCKSLFWPLVGQHLHLMKFYGYRQID